MQIGLAPAQDVVEAPEHASAAHRMRLHRARRRRGLRCVTIELREEEISSLIAKGLLGESSRENSAAIRNAIYTHLDRTLGGVS